MDQILNNPGLQNITENIFLNLDDTDLQKCQCLNKSSQQILTNPMFWLKKWKGLSKKSKKDWTKAIQITRNTHLEKNVLSYIKKAIKIGHIVDFPCYIDENVVEKSNIFTFETALTEKNLGILQISVLQTAFMERNLGMLQILIPMVHDSIWEWIAIILIGYAATNGFANVIKVLAPLIKNPITVSKYENMNTMHLAARNGKEEALKVLATFTDNFDLVDDFRGHTLMFCAALKGYVEIAKFLAPLMKNPNLPDKNGITPIQCAKREGHDELARILQSYIKKP